MDEYDYGLSENISSGTTCTAESVSKGFCYGMAVCGFCYDFGQSREITKEYETYNMIVIGIVLPAIGSLGLIGNSISAFVYSRPAMISSLNVYLCALAISDMTTIFTAFFLFFLENMRKSSAFISRFFATFAPVTFPLGLTAQSLSVFLTVAAALDCFLIVVGPANCKRRICSVKSSLKAIVCIALVASVYNSPHLFEIFVIECWSLRHAVVSLDVCPTALRQNQTYFTVYYAWMYTLVMAVGPVILLILLNTCIIISMRNLPARQNEGDSDAITLVLVVCLFITCNILPLTVNFLELFFGIVNSYLIDLSNLMVVFNSSCNFLIYYTFGSRFRVTLQHYVRTLFNKAHRRRMHSPKRIPYIPTKELLI
ncbi:hypothetical protein AB6A40_004514 [Gnathostoma spinigerum]|uniref:G-protein coupled receptors family 1 profile domain-containing protein n=1 Tax=Gnathostoma spinigerum TaxID=75299 RepID=A0ABD6ENE9_9BILA